MATRLIDLQQIRKEKIARSRAWIYYKIARDEFPKPLPLANSSKNLWDEAEIDSWLAVFIATAKAAVPDNENVTAKRTAKALAARGVRAAA